MQVDLANYLKKYWLVLVLTGVISGIVALTATFLMSDAYEATTTVMAVPRDEGIASGAMVNPSGTYYGTQADLVLSHAVMADTVESLGLAEAEVSRSALASIRDFLVRTFMWLRFGPAHETTREEEVIAALERNVETEVLEESGMLAITVTWSDADAAKTIADEIAVQYAERNKLLTSGDTERMLQEISAGMNEREQALAEATLALATFKQEHNIAADYDPVGPSGLAGDVRAELSVLEARMSGAESDYDYWRNLYQATTASGLTGGERADVLGQALTPAYPVGPDRLLYFAVGFLIGILIGLAYATWMEMSTRAVYTTGEVSELVGAGVPVVAVEGADA